MMEMACVSFSKVRLQYYLSKNYKSAICLSYLLNRPPLFFGTILISGNAALLVGSECSRRFCESIGISLGWAPLTQAFLVLVFAEISPMFSGRRYSEHAAMLGVRPVYYLALVLRPFVWLIDCICHLIHRIFGSSPPSDFYLSREELQNIIESREEKVLSKEKEELNTVVASIFSLKNKTAKELMVPVEEVKMLPISALLSDVRILLTEGYTPYIPLFHKTKNHIVSIAYPRDLLRLADCKKIKDHVRSPWFVTESITILQMLKQFRKNNQSIAVVLNQRGIALGILTLDKIIDEIFGKKDNWMSFADVAPAIYQIALDRSFAGDTLLEEFNKQYHMELHFKQAKTLAQAMELALGHIPRSGESVRIDQFELTVEETSLLGPKTIQVKTLS